MASVTDVTVSYFQERWQSAILSKFLADELTVSMSYKHGQFGFHTGVAKGSLGELKTHLKEVRTRGFLDQKTFVDLLKLLIETRKTTSGLLRHLKTTEAPEPWADDARS